MTRPIKFRARRIDSGKWVYGHYFKTPLTDENSGTTPDKGWFFLTGEPRHCISENGVVFVIDENTLGEFTGITDRNGREIWEGDILNYLSNLVSIRWSGELARYVIDQGAYADRFNFNQVVAHEMEVLGNIHEHSHLLSGDK